MVRCRWRRQTSSTPIVGVAEGAGLAHDAGNLLGALSLYSDLLAMPGVLNEEHREYANELRMLSDRSWAMINRLVNHSRAGLPIEDAGGDLGPSRCGGPLPGTVEPGGWADDRGLVWNRSFSTGACPGGGSRTDCYQPGEECGRGDALGRGNLVSM